MARRLGWLGPAIVIAGAAIAGVGVWYVLRARPEAGAVIEELAIDGGKLVVRAEKGGERSFLELRTGDNVKWQALIPRYAGAPGRTGLAWSEYVVTVRVTRNGRAEVFAFGRGNAAKIGGFRLAPEKEPIATLPEGPITITDQVRSYEFVGGADWHQLIAIDLRKGEGAWKIDLGKPAIQKAGIAGQTLWIEQSGVRRELDVATGRETPDHAATN